MMGFPELKRGDIGDDVIALQTELNKVGAMLNPDGDFGSGTERGVCYAQDIAGHAQNGIADQKLWEWLELQPEPFAPLNANGVAFIAKEETGGLAYYDLWTRWPQYPGEASGITIGVGYDLQFYSESEFKTQWGNHIPAEYLDELSKDLGVKGTKSRANELKRMGIQVPFKAAWRVFLEVSLPKYYADTQTVYSSIDSLPALCRAVLVSLVFNRGKALNGSRRTEMKAIQQILIQGDDPTLTQPERIEILTQVEDQILSMKRLWQPTSGLIQRRQAEANLWRKGLGSW